MIMLIFKMQKKNQEKLKEILKIMKKDLENYNQNQMIKKIKNKINKNMKYCIKGNKK